MGSNSFERTKPHVNVGTIGHMGYGRTISRELAIRVVGIGVALLMVEPKNDEFVLTIKEPFPEAWPSGMVKDSRITYGPQRKGKGGKVKRW